MEVTLENGYIIYENEINDDVIEKPITCVNVYIGEDIHDVPNVYRITAVNIECEEVDDEVDEELSEIGESIYNRYCNIEFFGESSSGLERKVSAFLSNNIGISDRIININIE